MSLLYGTLGVYNGVWMPQMDRCWESDDGFQVTSRLLMTAWGKIEHAVITYNGGGEHFLSFSGERDIPWRIKQEIKNEVFGERRPAIEIFPVEKNKVDVLDVYHLWVFPKDYKLPFGIHPQKDVQCKTVNRGCPADITHLVENAEQIRTLRGEKPEM